VAADAPPGYRTQSEDTSYEVEQLLFERWRTMDPGEKAQLVGEASVALRELAVAGLIQRLADVDRAELERRTLELLYGADVARLVFGPERSGATRSRP
jgi:hypothetical protein